MYDVSQKRMYNWDDPVDRHAICVCLERAQQDSNLRVMAYSQFNDDTGKEIYCADICDVEMLNEFGSITQKRAIMMSLEMPPWGYSFILEENTALMGKVVGCRLVGNMCENLDMVKSYSDHENRPPN